MLRIDGHVDDLGAGGERVAEEHAADHGSHEHGRVRPQHDAGRVEDGHERQQGGKRGARSRGEDGAADEHQNDERPALQPAVQAYPEQAPAYVAGNEHLAEHGDDDEDEDEVSIAELGEAAHARGPVLQLVPAEEEAGKQADDRGEDERLHAVVAYADGDDRCNDHVEKDRKSRETLRAVELQSEPLVFAVNPLMSQGKHRLSIRLLTSGPRSCAFY